MADYVFPDVPQLQAGDRIIFKYTGFVQTLDLEDIRIGIAKFECYGARGDGAGGYSYGTLDFKTLPDSLQYLYFVVGQTRQQTAGSYEYVTFGGGGASDGVWSGGGASDVRTVYDPKNTNSVKPARPFHIDKGTLNLASLQSRFIVAGGGGGLDNHGRRQGGGRPGGGWCGFSYGGHFSDFGDGGQTYSCGGGDGPDGHGSFGVGGSAWEGSAAGGGGWYGGSGSDGAGGGSSYVSGNPNCPVASTSGIKLTSSGTICGGNNVTSEHGLIVLTIIEPGFKLSTKALKFKYKNSPTIYGDNMYDYEMNNKPKGSILKCTPANYYSPNPDIFGLTVIRTNLKASPVSVTIKAQPAKKGYVKQ